MECTICGSPAPQVASKNGAPLYECPKCVFRFSPPCAEPLEVLYGSDYFVGTAGEYRDYASEEASHRRMARRYLGRMSTHIAPGSVLDVGCAHGFFLDEARRAGWVVQGVDVSEYAVTAACERKIPIIQGSFSSVALPNRQYDAVTFFNSLEHIPDPREVERRLAKIVKPGGVVVIETWDWRSWVARLLGLSWHQYDPKYVVSYFSRPAVSALICPSRVELTLARPDREVDQRPAPAQHPSKAPQCAGPGRARIAAPDRPALLAGRPGLDRPPPHRPSLIASR